MHQSVVEEDVGVGVLHDHCHSLMDCPDYEFEITGLNIFVLVHNIRTSNFQLLLCNSCIFALNSNLLLTSQMIERIQSVRRYLAIQNDLKVIEFGHVEIEAMLTFETWLEDKWLPDHKSTAVELGFGDVVDDCKSCRLGNGVDSHDEFVIFSVEDIS